MKSWNLHFGHLVAIFFKFDYRKSRSFSRIFKGRKSQGMAPMYILHYANLNLFNPVLLNVIPSLSSQYEIQ